jgi:hypothetical protein
LPADVGIVEFMLRDGRTPGPAAGNETVARVLIRADFRSSHRMGIGEHNVPVAGGAQQRTDEEDDAVGDPDAYEAVASTQL